MRSMITLAVTATMLLLGPGAVAAADENTGLTVTGHGRVLAKPDIAVINTGVEVRRPTAKEAYAAAMAAMDELSGRLNGAGVADKDVQTTGVSLHPERSSHDDGHKITGYRGTAGVRVTVRDVHRAGAVLDAAGSGGDETRISGIQFDVDDKTAVLKRARKEAIRDARAKAEEYAGHAGVELGDVVSITEEAAARPVPLEYDAVPLAGSGPTAKIHPGENEIAVRVRVVYELGEGEHPVEGDT